MSEEVKRKRGRPRKNPVVETNSQSSPTSEQINEQKQLQNRSKRYIKNNKEIRKQDKIRARKQIELEYIQKRLDAKKSKLESLKPDQVKGEKE